MPFRAARRRLPVVVLLHPCGGLEPVGLATLQAHARDLGNAGFATYILDSYGPRNLGNGKACRNFPSGSLRRADAFHAMTALQDDPRISKDNIFVLGLSDGGNAALLAAKGDPAGQFRAVAAFYPDCQRLLGSAGYVHKSAAIVFVGEKDDWTPPAACVKAKVAGAVSGAEFEVISYAGAHHGFDQQRAPTTYNGHTLAYSREATADSRKKAREFFLRHLTADLKAASPFAGER